MRAIRSYLFQAIMILSIPPFVTCAILFWPFPYSVRWTVIKQWARFQMRLLGQMMNQNMDFSRERWIFLRQQ